MPARGLAGPLAAKGRALALGAAAHDLLVAVVEAGGDDRDAHVVAQAVVHDGAEDDNIDDERDDGRDRTTMTKIATRINTMGMRTKTNSMLQPMPITMVIETVIGRSPGRRRREGTR